MLKTAVLILSLSFIFFTDSRGENLTLSNFTMQFKGTINNKLKIQMELERYGSELAGTYFYESVGTNIQIKGLIDNSGNFTINEFDTKGNQTGIFKGKFTADNIMTGTWSKPDGRKTMPFHLEATANSATTSAKQEVVNETGKSQSSVAGVDKNVEAKSRSLADWIFNVYTLIGWLLIVITGVVLGFKQRITVFRDYNDLGLIFLIALSPVVLFYLFSIIAGEQQRVLGWFIIIVETVLFLWIVIRTVKDNPNLLGALVALVTKLSLSILFIFNFLSFVAPQGKTAAQRAKSRYNALAILLIVAPLVFKLVRNKEGIFNPERALGRRGIGI